VGGGGGGGGRRFVVERRLRMVAAGHPARRRLQGIFADPAKFHGRGTAFSALILLPLLNFTRRVSRV